AVRRGEHETDPLPFHGAPRWGLSLVALPEEPVREQLASRAAALAAASPNPHAPYEAADLHVTVPSLEGFVDRVDDAVVHRYADRVSHALRGVGAIEIRFEGLFLTASGVVAGGVPNSSLQHARERLAVDADKHGWELVMGGDAHRIRGTAHASLIIFRSGGHSDDELVDTVTRSRHDPLGSMLVSRLALVTYTVTNTAVHLHHRAWVS